MNPGHDAALWQRSGLFPQVEVVCDVLLLDDDDLVLGTLAEALRDEELEVVEARTPDEAIARLGQDPGPKLLVTDLNLGRDRDGRDVARAARIRLPCIPIIFITGRPDTLTDWRFDERQTVLPKPFRPSELLAMIRTLLPVSGCG